MSILSSHVAKRHSEGNCKRIYCPDSNRAENTMKFEINCPASHIAIFQGISSHFSINAEPSVLLMSYSSIQHSICFILFLYQYIGVLEAIRHDFTSKRGPLVQVALFMQFLRFSLMTLTLTLAIDKSVVSEP